MNKFNKDIKYNSTLYNIVLSDLKLKKFHDRFNSQESDWTCHIDINQNLYLFEKGYFISYWYNGSDILSAMESNIITNLNNMKKFLES